MPIKFGTNEVSAIKYNGNDVQKVIYNGVEVWNAMPQLLTPTNLTASGTEVTFDESINATSYDVYADGTLIGNSAGEPVVTSYNVTYEYVVGSTTDQEMFFTINGTEQQVSVLTGGGTYSNVTKIRFHNYDDPLYIYVDNVLVYNQFAGSYEYTLTSNVSMKYNNCAYYYITTNQ